jgi:hypothetical protein
VKESDEKLEGAGRAGEAGCPTALRAARAELEEAPVLRQRRQKLKGLLERRKASPAAVAELEHRRQKADRRKQLQLEAGECAARPACARPPRTRRAQPSSTNASARSARFWRPSARLWPKRCTLHRCAASVC